MRSENKFNKIFVIESLADKDPKTGVRLYDDLNVLKVTLPHLKCELIKVKNIDDLSQTLKRIENEVKHHNVFPVIHMEVHGSKNGLQFMLGETPWDALKDLFININLSCKNHLLVTLAACEGVYMTRIVMPGEPSPFWGLIAPTAVISSGQLEVSFQSFYKEFLTSLNGDQALKVLNDSLFQGNVHFAFIHCINLYKTAYQNYEERFCHGKALNSRIENLVTKTKEAGLVNHVGLKEIRGKIKYDLKHKEKEFFEKCKAIFFMSDLFPENRNRFDIKYEDVINMK